MIMSSKTISALAVVILLSCASFVDGQVKCPSFSSTLSYCFVISESSSAEKDGHANVYIEIAEKDLIPYKLTPIFRHYRTKYAGTTDLSVRTILIERLS